MSDVSRTAAVERKTRESEVLIELDLDGSGDYQVNTGIAFFDHMLESFAKHGLFDLRLTAKGDLHVEVRVEVPTKLDRGQKEKLRDFAESIGEENSPMHESFLEKAKRFFGG